MPGMKTELHTHSIFVFIFDLLGQQTDTISHILSDEINLIQTKNSFHMLITHISVTLQQ